MLGAGETVVGHTGQFVPCPDNAGFYRAVTPGGERAGLQRSALAG